MSVQPIKDVNKIREFRKLLKNGIDNYHRKTSKKRNDRNELLFIVGINTGLRVSDLIKLKFSDLMDEDGNVIRSKIVLTEQKTSKKRILFINTLVAEVLSEYFHKYEFELNDYIFYSQREGGHLTRAQVFNILQKVADKLNMPNFGTHGMRKTFGWSLYKSGKSIGDVCTMLGQSSEAITLRYIGVTDDDIKDGYNNLNLG